MPRYSATKGKKAEPFYNHSERPSISRVFGLTSAAAGNRQTYSSQNVAPGPSALSQLSEEELYSPMDTDIDSDPFLQDDAAELGPEEVLPGIHVVPKQLAK